MKLQGFITEILKLTTLSQWQRISTHLNPADNALRGQKAAPFVQNERWASGPHFLTKSAQTWPQSPDDLKVLPSTDPEIKRNATVNILTLDERPKAMGPAEQGGGWDPEGEDQVVAVSQCKQGNGDQRHKIPADQKSHQKPNKYAEQAIPCRDRSSGGGAGDCSSLSKMEILCFVTGNVWAK